MDEENRRVAGYAIDVARLGTLFMRTSSGLLAMPYSPVVCRGMVAYQELVRRERGRLEKEVALLGKRWAALEAMRPAGVCRYIDIFGVEERIFDLQRRIDYRVTQKESVLADVRREEALFGADAFAVR